MSLLLEVVVVLRKGRKGVSVEHYEGGELAENGFNDTEERFTVPQTQFSDLKPSQASLCGFD